MDKNRLEYILKCHDISKEDLMKAEDWSSSTYYRKTNGENDWTVAEVNVLIELGCELEELLDIFFK